MRVKVLFVGQSISLLYTKQLLREKGILVYNCESAENISYLINELKPELIFTDHPSYNAEVYYSIENNENCGKIPVVYKLDEDDLYVVSHHTETSNIVRKNVITNNVIDAVKTGILSTLHHVEKPYHFHATGKQQNRQQRRA